MYLRSTLDFKLLGTQFLASATLLFVLVLPFVKYLGLYGYITGQILAFGIAGFMGLHLSHFRLSLGIDKEVVLPLIKIGLPIMMAGYLYGLLTSIDRWIVVGFLGIEQLGYYSLSIITIRTLTLLPGVISNLIYPRMAKTFGRTNDEKSLTHYIKTQFLGGYVIILPVFLAFYFLFPLFVKKFMPAYIPGIDAMRVILWGTLFLPLGFSFGDFLNTTGRQNYYLTVQALAVAINFLLTFLFVVKLNMGIVGAALGTSITCFCYSITLAFVSWYFVLSKIHSQNKNNINGFVK